METSGLESVRQPQVAEASTTELMASALKKPDWIPLENSEDVFVKSNAQSAVPPALELRDGLEGRLLAQPFRLPEVADTPKQTAVFRVAVDADGRVRAVVLQSSCGNVEADEKAAEALHSIKFISLGVKPQPLVAVDLGRGATPLLDWGSAAITWPRKTAPTP